jgi:hypothetical protein
LVVGVYEVVFVGLYDMLFVGQYGLDDMLFVGVYDVCLFTVSSSWILRYCQNTTRYAWFAKQPWGGGGGMEKKTTHK